MVSPQAAQQFSDEGYVVARGLFSASETARYIDYFMDMVHRGGDGWAEGGVDPAHPDPLKRYPRLLQPHRGDDVAFGYMIDPRIRADGHWPQLAARLAQAATSRKPSIADSFCQYRLALRPLGRQNPRAPPFLRCGILIYTSGYE